MYDPDLSKVCFTGPLAKFAPGWREVLVAEGYAASSAAIKLQLAAHLSRWLQENKFEAWDLTEPVIKAFLVERRATYTNQISIVSTTLLVADLIGPAPTIDWITCDLSSHQNARSLTDA